VEFAPGDAIGDYQVEAVLGRGAMGTVYAAVHPVIERRVAIKVLRPEMSAREEIVWRFIHEARAVNRIRHPGIVDVFGYGTTHDECAYLVMERLDGETLGSELRRGRVPLARACELLGAIADALAAAHAAGVVHRDLKPDNVFLVGAGRIKLLDFGLAKLALPDAPIELTARGQALGTPAYMAPEQARGIAIDSRADVYSLGALAFELFTGQPPFPGDNAVEVMLDHVTLEPPRPRSLAPALPALADTLVLAMLAKDPAQRPPLAEVRAQLARIAAAATRPPRWWLPLGAALLVLVGAAVAWGVLHVPPPEAGAEVCPAPAPPVSRATPPPPPPPPQQQPVVTPIAVPEQTPPPPTPRKHKHRRTVEPPTVATPEPRPVPSEDLAPAPEPVP